MSWKQNWEALSARRLLVTAGCALIGAAGLLIWRTPTDALIFLGCTLTTVLLVPHIARWATHRQMLAMPGGRDVHERATPRAGGVALFVPIAATLLGLALLGNTQAWGLLVGSTLVFGCGLVDDVRGVRPRCKIICQVLAGLALVAVGFELPVLSVAGLGDVALGWIGIPLLLFWVVLVSNALNLSDGLDGLASSLSILGMAVLVGGGVAWVVPIALAGTCLGFLNYNMPRARIFLGDSGSLLLGFLLAALALKLPTFNNVPIALAACAYPLGDVALSVSRRFVRGKPLFAPDSSHLHHKAVFYLGGVRKALASVLVFAGIQGALGVFWPGAGSLAIMGGMWLGAALVVARLGSYKASSVLGDRLPMQLLHSLQRYVTLRVSSARSRQELEHALRHFVEGAGLCAASVDDLTVLNRDGCSADHDGGVPIVGDRRLVIPGDDSEAPCRGHTLPLVRGRASWRAPTQSGSPAVLRERETVVVSTLRRAHERLLFLEARGSASQGGAA